MQREYLQPYESTEVGAVPIVFRWESEDAHDVEIEDYH